MSKQKKLTQNSRIENDPRLPSGHGTLPRARITSSSEWEKAFSDLMGLAAWEWYHPLAGSYLLMIQGNLVAGSTKVLVAGNSHSNYFRIGNHAYEPSYALRTTLAHTTAYGLFHTAPKDIQAAGNASRQSTPIPIFDPSWPESKWEPMANCILTHGNSFRSFYTAEDWEKRLHAEGESAVLMFEMAHHLHGKMTDPSLSSQDKEWMGMAWAMCMITAIGHCCRFPLLTQSDTVIAQAKKGIQIHQKVFSIRNPLAHSQSIGVHQDAFQAISLADSLGVQSWMMTLTNHYFGKPSLLMSQAVAPTASAFSSQPLPSSSEKKSQKKTNKTEVKEKKPAQLHRPKVQKNKDRGPTEDELFALLAQDSEEKRQAAIKLSQTPQARLEKALHAIYQGVMAYPYQEGTMRPEAYEVSQLKRDVDAIYASINNQRHGYSNKELANIVHCVDDIVQEDLSILCCMFDYKKDFTKTVIIEGKTLKQWKEEIVQIIVECEDFDFLLTMPKTKKPPILLKALQQNSVIDSSNQKLPVFLALMAYLNFIYEEKFFFEDLLYTLANKMGSLSCKNVGAFAIITHQLYFYATTMQSFSSADDFYKDFTTSHNRAIGYHQAQLAQPLLSFYEMLSEFGLAHLTIQSENMTEWFMFPKVFASLMKAQPREPLAIKLERYTAYKDEKGKIHEEKKIFIATDIPDFYTKKIIDGSMSFYIENKQWMDSCIKNKEYLQSSFLKNDPIFSIMLQSYKTIIDIHLSLDRDLRNLKENIDLSEKEYSNLIQKNVGDIISFIFMSYYREDIKDFYEKTYGSPMVVPETLSIREEFDTILDLLHQKAAHGRRLPSEMPRAIEAAQTFPERSRAISD